MLIPSMIQVAIKSVALLLNIQVAQVAAPFLNTQTVQFKEMPEDLIKVIVWDNAIPAQTAQISTLSDKIAYCLEMRTVNKATYGALTMEAILDFCKPIDREEITLFFRKKIDKCPRDTAKLLIQHGADINASYVKFIDTYNMINELYDTVPISATLLTEAIRNNNPELAQKLQALGARLS
jgi:hypothetical protein